MERLGTLDAEFLHVEDERSPMHIGGVGILSGPAPSVDELRDLVAAKVHRIGRYRQVVKPVPLELGRPIWVDDPTFDPAHHVHAIALPEPHDDDALSELTGMLMSQRLDRERPLWELWLVEGLPRNRWALVCKVHHCMVDGIAGVGILEALLDPDPDAPLGTPLPWRPRPEPSAAGKVLGTWVGLAADGLHFAGRLAAAARTPRASAKGLVDLAGGIAQFVPDLVPTPHASIEGPIGAHRAWRHASVSLDHIREIRRAFGGTVNDVVLAAVTGGYRDLLAAHGDDPAQCVVRTAIPASTRHAGDVGANRVSTMLLELPVGMADPLDRLVDLSARMVELKHSHMVEAGELVLALADFAPPMVVGRVSRLALKLDRRVTQRSVTTVVTNVPGPQLPLYCLGHHLLAYYPYVGLSHGVRVTTAVMSYDGRLGFGLTGDEDSVSDVDVLAAGIEASISQLLRRARRATRATRTADA